VFAGLNFAAWLSNLASESTDHSVLGFAL
jgi:hypothetical protein